MIKSALYVIFSVVFLLSSMLMIGWIVKQEVKNNKSEQANRMTLSEGQGTEKNAPIKNQDADEKGDVVDDKEEADDVLADIDDMIDAIGRSELPE